MKKFGTGIRGRQSALPAPRHLPLVDILVDAQAELQELVVASGLKVLAAMLEEDRVAVCGPRYAHQPARRASRAGHAPSEVVLGGRKVALRRPRVRLDGQEVALPSVQAFTNTDPLTWGTSRMLLKFSGGSVHDYATISDACRRTASRAAAKHPSSSPKTSRGCWVGLPPQDRPHLAHGGCATTGQGPA